MSASQKKKSHRKSTYRGVIVVDGRCLRGWYSEHGGDVGRRGRAPRLGAGGVGRIGMPVFGEPFVNLSVDLWVDSSAATSIATRCG